MNQLKNFTQILTCKTKNMKAKRFYSLTKNIFFFVFTSILVGSISSCATKTHFLNSSIVPAAEGTVKVKKDKNHNYVIAVSVSNLAEPSRLNPPKNVYLVWMEGDVNDVKNIGQIKTSSSLLSKQLKSSFETVSSVKPRKVFITAETDASSQYPNQSDIVLTTDYLKR